MVGQLEEVPKMMSHNEIHRRTAEQIVDLPAPVFTDRISARILGLNACHRSGRDLQADAGICSVQTEQDFVEVDKDNLSGADFWTNGHTDRSYRLVEVPKISCRRSVEAVKSIPHRAKV